ncbi:MAG TPA: DUF1302 family protein [Nevskiaceae bacterium]|nr:DUF1302 family protein [Nevskiaceae bacterium]
MKMRKGRPLGLAAALLAAAPAVQAQDEGLFGSLFEDVDVSLGGFVRAETAFRTTAFENPNNQGGNVLNDRTVQRTAFLPPTLGAGAIRWGDVPLGVAGAPTFGGVGLPLQNYSDVIRRGNLVPDVENEFNYMILRGETEVGIKFGEKWSLVGRVRAIYDPAIYDEFSGFSLQGLQDAQVVEADGTVRASRGVDGGDPRLYAGTPNYFQYIVEGQSNPNPLEVAGRNYLVYFPALVLDYSSGPFSLRVGNQQIAWGQSLFFRVFDVPNGLDFRRHLIADRAVEEFGDKRVPQLAIRSTYQVTDNILADAFVGKFQPQIFPNPNTPYNVIPVQFTVHDAYFSGGFDDEINYGLRLKGDYGQWGFQAMAVRRFAPEGTFSWTRSGLNKPLSGSLGNLVNQAYALKLKPSQPGYAALCGGANYDAARCALYETIGEALAETPFEASGGGVYSQEEWFNYAAQVRLNGFTGLNASIEDFPASRDVYASPVDLPPEFGGTADFAESRAQANAQLNTFFMGAGGSLRGHIERLYHQENVFGLGVSYVNESDNDFLNQLIFNVEVQYTPERHFTNTGLQQQRIVQDEYTASLVVDKWHRFFNEFPGTYIVFQAFTRQRADLVGRHLSGYGGSEAGGPGTGLGHNANYLVFGFLQPFPNKVYEFEFVSLFDPEGGLLVQPNVRWNPGKGITVEGFYNYINGELYGNPNDNLVSTIDFAEEFTMRISYQF